VILQYGQNSDYPVRRRRCQLASTFGFLSKHSESYWKVSKAALRMLRVIFKKHFIGSGAPQGRGRVSGRYLRPLCATRPDYTPHRILMGE